MTTRRKTITLSEKQDDWVKSRIASGDFTNDSEYLRDLIRKDQERAEKIARMQSLIDEGLASGVSDKSFEELLEEFKAS